MDLLNENRAAGAEPFAKCDHRPVTMQNAAPAPGHRPGGGVSVAGGRWSGELASSVDLLRWLWRFLGRMVDHYVVSEAEWASGGLSPAKLQCLARSFARDGAVVLENCLPHAVLDALSRRMDSDAAHQLAESKWKERGPNGAGGHLQQGPPRHAPYVHREIVANMFLEQAATAALGGASGALSPLPLMFQT